MGYKKVLSVQGFAGGRISVGAPFTDADLGVLMAAHKNGDESKRGETLNR